MLPVNFVVDTTKDARTYANYRIFMTARLYDADSKEINSPGNYSDFITYTLTRVNLQGIS